MRLWHIPVRLATGAYILDSGIDKWAADGDEETEKHLHSMAGDAYPQVLDIDPGTFTRMVGGAEIALGAGLLLPIVPAGVAGVALGAYSSGLVGMYLRLPGLRKPGTVRPNREGAAMAKDSWLLAIAAALVIDAVASGAKSKLPGRR